MPFVLASRSPQRVRLLQEAGFVFDCDPADVDESNVPSGLSPEQTAKYLALVKAKKVAERHPDRIVLGADTIVALNDQQLGKPEDADHARLMLSALSGTSHRVVTGVAIVAPSGGESVDHVVTTVSMRPLLPEEVDRYIASGQWKDRAGGYGMQDDDPFVSIAGGSRSNVIGLPIERTIEMLLAAGVRPGK